MTTEYTPDPLLDEEVNEALVKNDPTIIWRMIATLAAMDEAEYQIHRTAIKNRMGSAMNITALDAARRKATVETKEASSTTLPPNKAANLLLEKYDVMNVLDNYYMYDGRKWVMKNESAVHQLALLVDGEEISTNSRRQEITSFIKAKIYKSEHKWRQIEIYEIPVANGVVDIRTMQVFEHRKEDYIQTCIPWQFKPDSQCPELMRCLDTYFGKDDDGDMKIAALQEFFGYCLMPHARYKKALLCVGESDCGKSTIPFLLRTLLGNENIAGVGVEHMDDERKRAPLLGKLVNLLTELTSDAMIADGGFKTLVSTEEPILFDPKHLAPVMDTPICKHVFVTNTKPKINDKSNATFRRLLLIHFNHVIPQNEQDTLVWDKLKNEITGILSWALEGAARLYKNGGKFTDPGADEVKEYKREQNPIQGFIEDCCEVDEDYRCRSTTFVERFRNYHGGRWTPQQVFAQLRSAGFETTKNQVSFEGSKYRVVLGLRLVSQ